MKFQASLGLLATLLISVHAHERFAIPDTIGKRDDVAPLIKRVVETGICGDGIKQDNEECDDGNKINDDSCTNSCKCGPGFVFSGAYPLLSISSDRSCSRS